MGSGTPAVGDFLKFGAFIPPLHDPTHNPTLALQRDLELVEHLDALGLDEAWFGEHHGLGWETIPEPEIFIAAAAQRTTNIKLATGVVSLPYHHPFVLADRWVFLDHLTRGRAIIGVGPGAFPSDAYQMGLPYQENRRRMEEALGAILALVDGDEPVTVETDWFRLQEARLNLRPYTRPRFEIAVASVVSPSGAKLAGRHGLSLLSIAANTEAGHAALSSTWATVEAESEENGTTVDRSNWRLNSFFHIADTERQARQDVRYGLKQFCAYRNNINPAYPLHDPALTDMDEIIDDMQKSGLVVIGTPDRLVEHIRTMQRHTGGFGVFLAFGHEMANREATRYSYELLARQVKPLFDGSTERPQAAFRFATSRDWNADLVQAWDAAKRSYEVERAAKGLP